jgi:leucyl/phenylalanyl-tRNA---protein transferase
MDILTPELVLYAYRNGYFPMAEEDGSVYWHCPDPRAIIPLEGVKVSRSLAKIVTKNVFDVRFNTAFGAVIRACSERDETWISQDIIEIYTQLHDTGYAHSVEAWLDGQLVGGLYGIAIGSAFFGESMFSTVSNASKVAYVHCTNRLRERGFTLLDSQYINPHMESLGAVLIAKSQYYTLLRKALRHERSFA